MDNLIEFDRTKVIKAGGSVYLPIPRITKHKYGITDKNAKQFHVRYFHTVESDDVVIRIEKIEVVI